MNIFLTNFLLLVTCIFAVEASLNDNDIAKNKEIMDKFTKDVIEITEKVSKNNKYVINELVTKLKKIKTIAKTEKLEGNELVNNLDTFIETLVKQNYSINNTGLEKEEKWESPLSIYDSRNNDKIMQNLSFDFFKTFPKISENGKFNISEVDKMISKIYNLSPREKLEGNENVNTLNEFFKTLKGEEYPKNVKVLRKEEILIWGQLTREIASKFALSEIQMSSEDIKGGLLYAIKQYKDIVNSSSFALCFSILSKNREDYHNKLKDLIQFRSYLIESPADNAKNLINLLQAISYLLALIQNTENCNNTDYIKNEDKTLKSGEVQRFFKKLFNHENPWRKITLATVAFVGSATSYFLYCLFKSIIR